MSTYPSERGFPAKNKDDVRARAACQYVGARACERELAQATDSRDFKPLPNQLRLGAWQIPVPTLPTVHCCRTRQQAKTMSHRARKKQGSKERQQSLLLIFLFVCLVLRFSSVMLLLFILERRARCMKLKGVARLLE